MSATSKEPRKSYLPATARDRLLPLYDPLQRLLGMGSVHRQLVDQARLEPDQRILEIGCGTGNLAILIKRLHPGAEVPRASRARMWCLRHEEDLQAVEADCFPRQVRVWGKV